MMRSSLGEHFCKFSVILLIRVLFVIKGFSNNISSVLTSKARESLTKTARLNFVFPVSIWLMCVVEIPTFSASSSWEKECAFLNFRICCPIK